MRQRDRPAVSRVGQEPAPQNCSPIMPPDELLTEGECRPDCQILPTDDASASETISVGSNQLLRAEQFRPLQSKIGLADVPEIRAPRRDEMLASEPRDGPGSRFARRRGALLAALGIGLLGGSTYYGLLDYLGRELSGNDAIATVVARIIEAESSGCPNAKNKRSSALGTGQFVDETWVRLIRAHRPDIARRSEREILELRRDPELAREITTRLAEQNAAKLRKHGFSITRGTLYLSHFAGGAGAVAILSAPQRADAATIMASADATGRTTRERIVSANPFLQRFTVADLKDWADRKMGKRQDNQICDRIQRSSSAGNDNVEGRALLPPRATSRVSAAAEIKRRGSRRRQRARYRRSEAPETRTTP
jgi:hypothetical protein